MKKDTTSNMFTLETVSIQAVYGPFITGNPQGTVLVLGDDLSDAAHDALEKSAQALEYGDESLIFVQTELPDGVHVGATDILTIIEGLDPLCCIITDEDATLMAGQAYGITIPLDAHSRVFGRGIVAFRTLNALLDSEEGKQRAWALLKTLRRQ